MTDDKGGFKRNRIAAARLALLAVAVLVVMLLVVPYARADNTIIMTLKTAKFSITRTDKVLLTAAVTCPHGSPVTCVPKAATYTTKTVKVGSYPGWAEVIAAFRTLPPSNSYRVVVPSPYVVTTPCLTDPTKGICLDTIDQRVLP